MASSFREFAFSKTSWHFAGAAHFAQRRAISAGELKRTLMIEIGLVGFGLAGRAFHAPVIRAVPGLHLAAILQRSGNEAAEKYPDVRIVRNLDELLSIREIRLNSEEHTSELQSRRVLVCRLLLEKKKKRKKSIILCCQ